MAGRLYRMAKVVSANPKSWGIVDANEISGFKRVAKLSDLYSIAECILSSSYGDGVTDGVDAVGQIWHVSETNGDYKLINWANRKSAAGWTKLSYGGDVSVPVKDVKVDGTTVLSNGVANINLSSRLLNYATTAITNDLKAKVDKKADNTTVTAIMDTVSGLNTDFTTFKNSKGQENGLATLDAHGLVPLDQLGNLDMTVFTVVESLPTSNIENKVYLVRSSLTSDKNNYIEYIYTGDRKGTYDATKWEKLGEVAAKTDLSGYYKKTEIDTKVNNLNNADIQNFTITPSSRGEQGGGKSYYMQASIARKGANPLSAIIPCVVSAADTTNANAGLMSPADKQKLDGIAALANKYIHPVRNADASGEDGLYKITVNELGHVSKTTAVTKDDITALGIPGSAPTVDAAMSDTSTNAVQNRVIDNAIKTHKINNDNIGGVVNISDDLTNILLYSRANKWIGYNDDSGACYRILSETTEEGLGIPKIGYSQYGDDITSYLLRDVDMVALTDTELNEILK